MDLKVTRKYVEGDDFPYHYMYPHMAVTTDCVIFSYYEERLMLLLIRRGTEPFEGEWALPGGYLLMDETLKDGAIRELEEEARLSPVYSHLEELGAFSKIDRDPRERTITVAFVALVPYQPVQGATDAKEAKWFPVDEKPEKLAFDHGDIFEKALEYLRQQIFFKPIGFDLIGEEFTLPALQKLYEAILGRTFDRANFQKKIRSMEILEEVPDEKTSGRGVRFNSSPFSSSVNRRAGGKDEFKALHSSLGSGDNKEYWSRKVKKYRLIPEKYREIKEDEKGPKMEF
ncbi:MAG: NUDIX hydrolase [Bacteroidales bacterium]|nr:NUDIX hydrolase [Bacteroidales bacterium]